MTSSKWEMWSLSITDAVPGMESGLMNEKAFFANSALPIGVFDSGLGGLTVLKELMRELPHERFLFLGDSARCPYGPRPAEEVSRFVQEICTWLVAQGCKMIVIACNTATATGLALAQRTFSIPIVGVVVPGARAAVHMTHTRRVGVIATEGTVRQQAYEQAIHLLDAGIEVFQKATPEFVQMVESGFAKADAGDAAAWMHVEDKDQLRVIHEHLLPLKEERIDTLVLGCTHFPLLQDRIAEEMGPDVTLVSSAQETAREVEAVLARRRELNEANTSGGAEIFITGQDGDKFARVAGCVLGREVPVRSVRLCR